MGSGTPSLLTVTSAPLMLGEICNPVASPVSSILVLRLPLVNFTGGEGASAGAVVGAGGFAAASASNAPKRSADADAVLAIGLPAGAAVGGERLSISAC